MNESKIDRSDTTYRPLRIGRPVCAYCRPTWRPQVRYMITRTPKWLRTCWRNYRRYTSAHQKRNWRKAPVTHLRLLWWAIWGPPYTSYLSPFNADHLRQQGHRHMKGVMAELDRDDPLPVP